MCLRKNQQQTQKHLLSWDATQCFAIQRQEHSVWVGSVHDDGVILDESELRLDAQYP